MKQWIQIALRNIAKNRRRSLMTLLAIAMGFAAISLFGGYTHNTYQGLRRSAIRGEGLGHLTIYKNGFLEKGQSDPQKFMFDPEELIKIKQLLQTEKEVQLVTPQLYISGLLSNGLTSNIFIAKGVVPEEYRALLGEMAEHRPITGESLSDREEYKVLVSQELANQMELPPNSDATVMATTLDGQMNALDVTVAGNYDTGSEATNDKFMMFSLGYAQQLYDTQKVDRITVLLDDWQHTLAVKERISAKLQQVGLNCQIKTWEELSVFFNQVKGMFDIIFLFLFSIVLVIVVMSTINTMSMSVVERTREIGTLRALGLKRGGVMLLFGVEGALLGFLGSMLGIMFNLSVWLLIKGIAFTYIPPSSSTPVPLMVDMVPQTLLFLLFFLMLLSLLAAILPARKAARLNVVNALGHV
jgi:putative ABC transport system permease protein